jgi:regulator of sigma E protease
MSVEMTDSSEESREEKNEEIVGYMPLETGDILLKIDGHSVYMITDYVDALNGKKAGEEVELVVIRKGDEKTLTMKLFKDADFQNMSAGQEMLSVMGFEKGEGLSPVNVKQNFFQTIGSSFGYSVKIGGTVLRSLGELLTGKIGLDSMGGPVTTIQVTSQVAANGWGSFLNIASFIGVNLVVFNLLPIPALDGCKVIFCIIEWIRKKPVNRKVETIIHFIGIIALFGFAILVDVLQLFRNIL